MLSVPWWFIVHCDPADVELSLIKLPADPVTVNNPFILKVLPAVNWTILAAVGNAIPPKVMAGEPEPFRMLVAVVSKVTVPELWLKVPLFVKLTATLKEPVDPGAVNVPLAEIETDPLISSAGLFDAAVTVTAFVPLPIVRSFETVIVWDAPVPSVIVGSAATAGAIVKL